MHIGRVARDRHPSWLTTAPISAKFQAIVWLVMWAILDACDGSARRGQRQALGAGRRRRIDTRHHHHHEARPTGGRPDVYQADDLESLQETVFWLSQPGIRDTIAAAEREYAEGSTVDSEALRDEFGLPPR